MPTQPNKAPERYYIASLKHTHKDHEHITFWGCDHRGYVLVIGERTGEYGLEEARMLNDGVDYIAVPVEVVKSLISPEPYFSSRGIARRFYDTPGPVVDNTKANWSALIAASLEEGRAQKRVRPEPYTKQRRSFAIEPTALALKWARVARLLTRSPGATRRISHPMRLKSTSAPYSTVSTARSVMRGGIGGCVEMLEKFQLQLLKICSSMASRVTHKMRCD